MVVDMSGQVRSGQVRVFNVHIKKRKCCSARLSRAQIPADTWFLCPGHKNTIRSSVHYFIAVQEQFHTSVNKPLKDERTRTSAARPNVHFASLKKESLSSGGGIMVVSTFDMLPVVMSTALYALFFLKLLLYYY